MEKDFPKSRPKQKNLHRHEIIQEYKSSVQTKAIPVFYHFETWEGYSMDFENISLKCYEIDPLNLPCRFTTSVSKKENKFPKYQFSIYNDEGVRIRPQAWRIPFLDHFEFENGKFTVSHLCHNNQCYNWEHHTFETLEQNKARNGCPGGSHCHHQTQCLRPGPQYNF